MVLHSLRRLTFFSSWLALASCAGKGSPVLTLIHTNDIHGHLSKKGEEGERLTRLRALISEKRKSGDLLLLDAGDAIGDTGSAQRTQGASVAEILGELRYDALAPGNHEYDFGLDRLKSLRHEFGLPILAANLTDEEGKLIFPAFEIVKKAGKSFLVIGLTYPNTAFTTAKANTEGLRFPQDHVQRVKQILADQEGKHDFAIVLSHLGLGADIQLAKRVHGIDLIVGGHSHNRITEPLVIGSTRILQAGAHLGDAGVGALKLSQTLRLESYALTKLGETTADLEKEGAIVGIAAEPISRAQVVAGSEPHMRDQESPADSFFADLLKAELKVDIVFLPGVGYGLPLPVGPVTEGELRNLIPHNSKMVIMNLSGGEILKIIEQSLKNVYTDNTAEKVGGMIQVGGLRFKYSAAGGEPALVSVKVGKEPIGSERIYSVATNELLASGGHFYSSFLKGSGQKKSALSQFELVKKAWGAGYTKNAPALGRINRLD